jgi:pyruvate formate lyase activating enzyme
MKIAGIEKCSLVDYPGKLACAFFAPACNMNCLYCHNRHLLRKEAENHCLAPDAIRAFLTKRRGFLDGVVISGGEPTLHPGLGDFACEVRAMGFPVKIDTNGTRPETIRRLIASGAVDYISMDVKAPLAKYEAICGAPVKIAGIEESIDLLLEGRVEYEFRTTVPPQLNADDLSAIAERIRGARLYVLQQCRMPKAGDTLARILSGQPSHSPEWLRHMAGRLSPLVQRCETRGV